MTDKPESIQGNSISPNEWLRIHNNAAYDYKISEWTREFLLGLSSLRKQLFSQATGNVLDVACGYGLNFTYLPNATQISGVDFSPVMLDMARDQIRMLGLPIILSKGDAEALEFPDNTFDTVVSALATCSFLNPIAALQEMRRVCKPGGRILLIEHGRSDREWLGWYQDRRAENMLKQSGCRWNQEPQTLVQDAGLNIIQSQRTWLGVFHTIEALPAKSDQVQQVPSR